MDCKDYSTMSQFLRVTAYVLSAVRRFKNRTSRCNDSTQLTTEKLADSEALWIIHAQVQLAHDKSFNVWPKQLDFFVDDKGYGDVVGDSHMLTSCTVPNTRIYFTKIVH